MKFIILISIATLACHVHAQTINDDPVQLANPSVNTAKESRGLEPEYPVYDIPGTLRDVSDEEERREALGLTLGYEPRKSSMGIYIDTVEVRPVVLPQSSSSGEVMRAPASADTLEFLPVRRDDYDKQEQTN